MFSTPERRRALAAVIAGAMMTGAVMPASAAPVMTSAASLRAVTPDHSVDVRWRGRGGAVFGGLAAGLALGAIAASRPRYYAPGYAYADPYYGPPAVVYEPPAVYYEPAPTYYAPAQAYAAPPGYGAGPVRQCWVSNDDRGYGYWRPC
jgi:hypothetical protein